MANLVTFINSNLDQPENGEEMPRIWKGYGSRTEELLPELLYSLKNL